MPKIIENIQTKLMEEARREIETEGYGAMTVRSVAKACGVGVGTVYNYYPSKDDLVADYLLTDWKKCIAGINRAGRNADTAEEVLRYMYRRLVSYAKRHAPVFRDEAAKGNFAGAVGKYHGLLRSQLASPIRRFCDSDFAAEFVAESLLVWSMNGRKFDQIYEVIGKLF